ncbi:MAG: hypothetical protein QGH90_06950 [Candidatus Poseidoniaceae archaeon]|nr:hypothetical protein [Candidatus Poseidoniaceae archaeon]
MAKKKRGFGKFLGALTGSPYERLLKQIEKTVKENGDSDRELARALKKFSRIVQRQYEEGNIDDEEHDLLMEEIEEVDPEGRSFPKIDDDGDEFYDGDIPDAPALKGSKKVNLDELMRPKEDAFTGSFGREEFDEFRSRMADDFYADSEEAIQSGDHQADIRTQHRVFADDEEDAERLKREIVAEGDLVDPNAQAEQEDDDENYRVDEDGTEWWKDDDGYWWYRDQGEDDWQPFEE